MNGQRNDLMKLLIPTVTMGIVLGLGGCKGFRTYPKPEKTVVTPYKDPSLGDLVNQPKNFAAENIQGNILFEEVTNYSSLGGGEKFASAKAAFFEKDKVNPLLSDKDASAEAKYISAGPSIDFSFSVSGTGMADEVAAAYAASHAEGFALGESGAVAPSASGKPGPRAKRLVDGKRTMYVTDPFMEPFDGLGNLVVTVPGGGGIPEHTQNLPTPPVLKLASTDPQSASLDKPFEVKWTVEGATGKNGIIQFVLERYEERDIKVPKNVVQQTTTSHRLIALASWAAGTMSIPADVIKKGLGKDGAGRMAAVISNTGNYPLPGEGAGAVNYEVLRRVVTDLTINPAEEKK